MTTAEHIYRVLRIRGGRTAVFMFQGYPQFVREPDIAMYLRDKRKYWLGTYDGDTKLDMIESDLKGAQAA